MMHVSCRLSWFFRSLSSEDKAVNSALLEWAKDELHELVDKSESSAFIYNGIIGGGGK